MLSKSHRFVFVHIPKTGGTSIEKALSSVVANGCESLIKINRNPFRGPPRLQHLTASEYVRLGYVSQDDWNDYTTFAVVRNPWARLVSEYNARGRTRAMKLLGLRWSFKNFLRVGRPRWYEDNYLTGSDNYRHVVPQSHFVFSAEGETLVDHVVRLENLTAGGLAPVLAELRLEDLEIPRLNRSVQRNPIDGEKEIQGERLHYRDYYDDSLQNLVAERYSEDVELLGYKF